MIDFDARYAAVASRDRRFDGQFFTGVLTTGIYCRPSCPARTPQRRNVRFFPSPAAAQDAGLRACRRCRPELAPDRIGYDPAEELAGRAMRLIDAGEADDVASLAGRLHLSERHLRRVLTATYGVGPSALITMRRIRLARMLVDSTDLPLTEVAFAAGFGSVRQFNQAFRDAFHASPTDVRRGRATSGITGRLRIAARAPFDHRWVLDWLALHALPGRDEVADGTWVRQLDVGTVVVRPDAEGVEVELVDGCGQDDLRPVAAMVRHAFDTDADTVAMAAALGGDPVVGPLLAARPGLRIPGSPDPWEGPVRTLLGQQVSAAAANTFAARLAGLHEGPGLPPAAVVRDLELEPLIGLTRQRAGALRGLAAAVAEGLDLSPSADPRLAEEGLLAIRGIGPWTASTICLLALRQPDAWPAGDLALRRALSVLTGRDLTAKEADRYAERWRPWRGYAAMHLWDHYLREMT